MSPRRTCSRRLAYRRSCRASSTVWTPASQTPSVSLSTKPVPQVQISPRPGPAIDEMPNSKLNKMPDQQEDTYFHTNQHVDPVVSWSWGCVGIINVIMKIIKAVIIVVMWPCGVRSNECFQIIIRRHAGRDGTSGSLLFIMLICTWMMHSAAHTGLHICLFFFNCPCSWL